MPNIDLNNLSITTTNGEVFTGQEHARLAALVWKRFGYNTASAAAAWRRMLQNSCPDANFEELANIITSWIKCHE